MKFASFALFAAVLVLTSACGNSRRGNFVAPDGSVPGFDSGTHGGTLDGGPGLIDFGPGFDAGPGFDSGPGGRDMGPARVDAGRDSGPVTPACESQEFMRVTGPYCSSETQACTSSCTTGECITACLDADASADCSLCADNNLYACLTGAGCQTAWDNFACCLQTYCPDSTTRDACVITNCTDEDDAFGECATAVGTEAGCGTSWTDCF
ncbi:MAG: hypothetical protein IPK60_07400 [Sandaracinaceae bacterium]|jgi:hypothetical protein|nr:hypothetical protein [Sandaracinaceae bacterium]